MNKILATDYPDYRLLFESSPGLYLILTTDFRIVAASDAYLRATMTRREDIVGRDAFEVFPGNPSGTGSQKMETARASLERVVKYGNTDTIDVLEYDIRRPASEGAAFEQRYWRCVNSPVFNPKGELHYILHAAEDITELVKLSREGQALRTQAGQMEEKIEVRSRELIMANRELELLYAQARESGESRLKAVLDNVLDGIVAVNESGNIVSFNKACERMFGYSSEEAIGQNIKILMPEPYHSEHDGYIKRYVETGNARVIGTTAREVSGKRKDGAVFPMDLSVSTFQFNGKRHFSGIIRDITERKKTDALLKEQRESLEVFTRALAHDLREPMRTITSFANMVMRNHTPEKTPLYLQYIQNAASRMTMLIDTVFDYTQLDTHEQIARETVFMNKVLEEVKDNIHHLMNERNVTITVEPLPRIFANRVHMLQVMQNLIVNAIRHCSEHVKIHVRCEEWPEYWQFSVSDNGPGIDARFLENIFLPFKRLASAKEEGAGLGLSICRKIVELHKGRIWCESEKSKGATFFFTHPKDKLDTAAIKISSPKQQSCAVPVDGKALANILLVDDRKSDIELVKILIETARLQCNMLIAYDGSEALNVLRKENASGKPVDLVLLDINMPGMDGFEMLEKMRMDQLLKDTAVIMCTGSSYNKDKERAKSLGAVGYMIKPPVFDDMKPMLEHIPGLQLSVAGGGYALQRVA